MGLDVIRKNALALLLVLAVGSPVLAQVRGDHLTRCVVISSDDGTTDTCLCQEGTPTDRIFHDTNCDLTKDAGENYIDFFNIVDDTTPQLGADLECQGSNIQEAGVIFLKEQAEADGNVAGEGQIWVNTATPNELWFTDDADTDFQLGAAGAHVDTITWTGTPVLESAGAFQFGDASDGTVTMTYANTGTDVDIAYSTGAMAITGAVTATSYGGITEANLTDKSAAESISGLHTFTADGSGGLTSYDIQIGDTTTPDYGVARIGDSTFGRSSYSGGSLDIGGAVTINNQGALDAGNDPGIEFVLIEGGNTIRLAIPESGAGNATAMIRSVTVAGPMALNNNIVQCDTWTAYNTNLDCDTGGTGADLFVQDDFEVEGTVYAHETINFEGATADGNQVILQVGADPGADVTISLPTSTGTLIHTEANNLETIATGIADNEIAMGTGGNTVVYKTMPSGGTNGCAGAGEATQYNTTTDTWDCITGLGAGGTVDDIAGDDNTATTGANVSIDGGTGGIDTDVVGDVMTVTFDPTEVDGPTWGDGTSSTWVFDAGATDPTFAFDSDSLIITNVATLTVPNDSWGDAEVANNITIDLATVATTVTITDNESTDEENPLVFVAGADPDGGNLGLETDGNATYNPSSGTITAVEFVGGGGGLTGIPAGAINDLGDADGAGTVLLAENEQTWTFDSADTTTGIVNFFTLGLNHDSSSDSYSQRLFTVQRNATSGSTTMENILIIENDDTDGAVTNGIRINSAAGGMTYAIQMSDSDIDNAFGTPNATISMTELELLDGGTRTDEGLCTYEATGNQLECEAKVDYKNWPALGFTLDAAGKCADPTAVEIASIPLFTVICEDDNASTINGQVDMPAGYTGGTVTFTLAVLNDNATPAGDFDIDFECHCLGNSDIVASMFGGTEQAADIDFDASGTCGGSACVTNEQAIVTTSAVTCDGTCAASDRLYWQGSVDATGTTATVADVHILSVLMQHPMSIGE